MSEQLEWRGGEERRRAHCRRQGKREDENSMMWALLVLVFIIFVSGVLAISATRSEEPYEDSVGALAPDEIVFTCREDGDYVAVTAAINFGESTISEPVLVDDGSVHCRDGFVDTRDIKRMGGVNEILRFFQSKEDGLDPGVAETASYSKME